ncbi:MAG TPA: AmmeMemoRadiSam system protein B [Smithella sp.]|nr:AmmeMemoRadiSam system protein B [Smithella sp.]
MIKPVRKSVIAGSWYPGDPSVLRKNIEDYFRMIPDVEISGDVVGLISPHAGYMYSGHVAAHSYKLVRGGTYDVVIVIGPSHRVAFHGVSVLSRGGYETPLGIIPVAEDLAEELKHSGTVVADIPQAHLQEHSVEIQLPFLQVCLGAFSFLPLVMGDQDKMTCRELARQIGDAVQDKKILLVGSSDLSHFYHYNTAKKMDAIVVEHLKQGDADGLLQDLNDGVVEACGGGPMAVVMLVAKKLKADKAYFLKYANSGDVTGDKSSVVGYAAAAFCR